MAEHDGLPTGGVPVGSDKQSNKQWPHVETKEEGGPKDEPEPDKEGK